MKKNEFERLKAQDFERFSLDTNMDKLCFDNQRVDMENKIKGYRDLSQNEIDLINAVKDLASFVGDFCDKLASIPAIEGRWLAIARTELQKSFMFLTRAVAKPEGF